jgi:hypothetical protein
METRTKIPAGIERFTYDMNFVGILPTKSRMGTLYSTLETMHEEDPDSDIVIITETFFLGTHPMYLGAELPKGFTKRPRTINLHAMPYFIKSIDTGPVGMALLPDSSKEGRERMAQLRLKALKEEWSREMQRLESFRHPNIVYIHDAFENNYLFYLALERCELARVGPQLWAWPGLKGHVDRGGSPWWEVAAQRLIQKVVLAKQAADLHNPTFNQMLMHRVASCVYDQQVARNVAHNAHRRDAMLAALERHMPGYVTWTRPQGGMFVWVTLPVDVDGEEVGHGPESRGGISGRQPQAALQVGVREVHGGRQRSGGVLFGAVRS